jgi:hypothetical protein
VFDHPTIVSSVGVPIALVPTTALLFQQIKLPIAAMKSECVMFLQPCLPAFSLLKKRENGSILWPGEKIIRLFHRPVNGILRALWHRTLFLYIFFAPQQTIMDDYKSANSKRQVLPNSQMYTDRAKESPGIQESLFEGEAFPPGSFAAA